VIRGTCAVDLSGRPITTSEYIPSRTSRVGIPISGSIVPTAMWFPDSFFGERASLGIRHRHKPRVGRSSLAFWRPPPRCGIKGTSNIDTTSLGATFSESMSRMRVLRPPLQFLLTTSSESVYYRHSTNFGQNWPLYAGARSLLGNNSRCL
jgi:hypothetical protein